MPSPLAELTKALAELEDESAVVELAVMILSSIKLRS